jgi:hypothetical protein
MPESRNLKEVLTVFTIKSSFQPFLIISIMMNIKIEKPGEGVFVVKIAGSNRAVAEKELQEFIAGRAYTRYVDHFNPNNQIIEIHQAIKA